MRKYYLLTLLIILLQFKLQAGNGFESMWKNISLSSENPVPSDTMVVLYTTRHFDKNNTIVFNDQIDTQNEPKVVLAVCRNLSWKLYIMKDIDKAMSLMPDKKDLVVYVEGAGKTFPLAMYRSAGITTQYNVNVLMFDYPTRKETFSIAKGYYHSLKSIKSATKMFGAFLQQIQQYENAEVSWTTDKNKVLFIHSMGNRLLKETITRNHLPLLDTMLFKRTVLNAPCVNQAGHSKWIGKIEFSKEIYINYNRKDFRLLTAMLLSHRLLLGSYIHKPYNNKVFYINMKSVLGSLHNGFVYNPGRTTIPEKSKQYFSKIYHGENIETGNPFELRTGSKFLLK